MTCHDVCLTFVGLFFNIYIYGGGYFVRNTKLGLEPAAKTKSSTALGPRGAGTELYSCRPWPRGVFWGRVALVHATFGFKF